jgi:CRISPR-associated protein Csd1
VEKIPPKLSGEVIRSVFKGIQYPAQLRLLCMNRIRADRKVSRAQAAILKAYMNRLSRKNKREEISVALNRENKNVGYLIGRLFAVLEKIQNEALGDLNATITDRYYGAASTNPRTVFPQLLKLKNFHLAKIEKEGLKIAREKEIGEIMNGIDSSSSFPAHLNLDGQTMFALGYYHERESFFQKNNDNEQGE